MLVAHPLTGSPQSSAGPAAVGIEGVLLVAVVAILCPPAPSTGLANGRNAVAAAAAVRPRGGDVDSWLGSLTAPQMATRALAVAFLGLAIAAGRLGSERELHNLAPALVVGAAWPLLLGLSALVGPIWRWVDPWDGLARLMRAPAGNPGASEDVRVAVVPAFLWVWYLSAYQGTLAPRSIGAALWVYSIVTLAGCLALGRQLWLSRFDVFGLLFGWTARLPRGSLLTWDPPRGAGTVIGVLAGGLLFGPFRDSALWGSLSTSLRISSGSDMSASLGLIVFGAAAAGIVRVVSHTMRMPDGSGATIAALVPAVAALAIAIGMVNNRLFTSLQLLPAVLSDPFGKGWDLLGTSRWIVYPDPLGHTGLELTQVFVLVAGHLAGAFILARRTRRSARAPATLALILFLVAGVLAVTAL